MRNLDVLLKLNNFCDLACSYCYFEEGQGDNRSLAVLDEFGARSIALRLASACDNRDVDSVTVVYHGGEPTLVGVTAFEAIHSAIAGVLGERCLSYSIQTNAVRLDERWIDALYRHQINVGISCDGPPHVHDARRKTRGGRATGAIVIEAVNRCVAAMKDGLLFRGVLSVLTTPPSESLLRYFGALGVPEVGLLLPHPPHRLSSEELAGLGSYLASEFALWLDDETLPEVRLFKAVLSVELGGATISDSLGGVQPDCMTIYPGGDYGVVDTLGGVDRYFLSLGLNAKQHSIADALQSAQFQKISQARTSLPAACRGCDYRGTCRGGHLADRFAAGSFDNKSANCVAMVSLLGHVRELLYGHDAAVH
jgi:uncharacterized protein